MDEVIQHTIKKAIPVKKIIKFGNPANEIAITAAHEDADIILIPKDFFGSTECSNGRNANQKLSELSPCPVILMDEQKGDNRHAIR